MANIYKCTNCGAVTTEKGHLCAPEQVAGKGEYCGASGKAAGQACASSAKSAGQACGSHQNLAYECEKCGRPAEQADLLCKPTKIAV
jgi:hypothetical protein